MDVNGLYVENADGQLVINFDSLFLLTNDDFAFEVENTSLSNFFKSFFKVVITDSFISVYAHMSFGYEVLSFNRIIKHVSRTFINFSDLKFLHSHMVDL